MIDFNDRFTVLMIGIFMVLAFFAYFAIFGETEKKEKLTRPRIYMIILKLWID